ncbi:MAG: TetR/AcrR family transcriptional regulator [Gordonia sp. (in: high G+C Gram-positive bacteria)]|uniref:TetR/AcrR family transcriptional regulator n=1 Tax=Gordonia sp. (in: high G+C Gram-positive bacteria) TaxID=84139 RepID=UPI0039E60C73
MARPPDANKRAEIAARTAEYLASHGIAETSLRTVAAELGTTARMLVHYFGTKEQLFTAALESQRQDFAESFTQITNADELKPALIDLWRSMTIGERATGARLLMQVLAAGGPYQEYARSVAADISGALQLALQRAGISPVSTRALSLHLSATFRGLLLERFNSDDPESVDESAVAILSAIADWEADYTDRRGSGRAAE